MRSLAIVGLVALLATTAFSSPARANQLTVQLHVGVSVPQPPCKVVVPSTIALSPTGQPATGQTVFGETRLVQTTTLASAPLVSSGCTSASRATASTVLVTQETAPNGSNVDVINF